MSYSLSSQQLGHYELLGGLGRGAMSEVYIARDLQLDRLVAVKVLSEQIVFDLLYSLIGLSGASSYKASGGSRVFESLLQGAAGLAAVVARVAAALAGRLWLRLGLAAASWGGGVGSRACAGCSRRRRR